MVVAENADGLAAVEAEVVVDEKADGLGAVAAIDEDGVVVPNVEGRAVVVAEDVCAVPNEEGLGVEVAVATEAEEFAEAGVATVDVKVEGLNVEAVDVAADTAGAAVVAVDVKAEGLAAVAVDVAVVVVVATDAGDVVPKVEDLLIVVPEAVEAAAGVGGTGLGDRDAGLAAVALLTEVKGTVLD